MFTKASSHGCRSASSFLISFILIMTLCFTLHARHAPVSIESNSAKLNILQGPHKGSSIFSSIVHSRQRKLQQQPVPSPKVVLDQVATQAGSQPASSALTGSGTPAFTLPQKASSPIGIQMAQSQSQTQVVVFGDSLSDTGNLLRFTHGVFPSPKLYYEGRFADGPIWVDQLMLLDPSNATAASSFAYGGATACPASRPESARGPDLISALRIPSLDMQVLQYVSASNTTKTTAGSVFSIGTASANTTTSATASSSTSTSTSTSTMGMCGGYGPVANAPAERGRRLAVVWTGHNDYLGLLRQMPATAASSTLSAGASAPASAGTTDATTANDPATAVNSPRLGNRPVSAAAVADSPAEVIKRVVGCVVEGASALVRSGCVDGVVVWALAPLQLAPGVPQSLRSVASVIERQHNALLASALDQAGLARGPVPILQPGLVAKAAAPLPTAAAASLQGLRHSTLVLNGQEQGPAPQPVLPDGALPGSPLPLEEARIPAVIRNAHSSGSSSSSAADVASVPVHAASWGDEGLPIYVAFYNVTPIIQNIVRNAAQYNFSEADAPCLRDADDGNATTAGTSARRSSGLGWGLGSTDKVECWYPERHIWYDEVHPTARGHRTALSEPFMAALQQAGYIPHTSTASSGTLGAATTAINSNRVMGSMLNQRPNPISMTGGSQSQFRKLLGGHS